MDLEKPKNSAQLRTGKSRPGTPLSKLSLALSLLLLLPACRGTNWKQSLIYSRSPVAIYLEREVKKKQVVPQGFSHPAEIPSDRLLGLLSGLRYRSWGLFRGSSVRPVFEEAELRALIGPLAEGLKKANPEERVRFVVAKATWTPFLTGAKGTSAVVFLSSPDRLNVAFDLIDEALPNDGGDPRSMNFLEDPVTITGKTPEIEASPGVVIRPAATPD